MKLWQTDDSMDPRIEAFTTGNDPVLDQELIPFDCLATIAHVTMLQEIGILDPDETEKLVAALNELINLHGRGQFHIRPDQEDGHTAIEEFLTSRLGDAGKKVHTGRSRNDQVLTAIRLFEKFAVEELIQLAENMAASLKQFAQANAGVPLPGYTHTRKAMPFSVKDWAMAFHDALKDDIKMLHGTYELIDQNPLGTGAGYGVPLPLNRQITTDLMGFSRILENPMYAQNSRGKFESRILNDCLMILFDLNKWASDLIFFTLPEIGYFNLDPSMVTGSSIMPHKQNPDVLELIRASYHQVAGYEYQLRMIPVNLISGYHRDLQYTKEPLMKGLKICRDVLGASQVVLKGLTANPDNLNRAMTSELLSVQKVMDLVNSGMPFRDAYRQVKKLG
ncbi:MAG: argininosuccinate lyase [Porphyromonadaceae bacterium]|nr:MAG: argininosuccinate lyase [Porphyromonadaceae bacterium]